MNSKWKAGIGVLILSIIGAIGIQYYGISSTDPIFYGVIGLFIVGAILTVYGSITSKKEKKKESVK